MLKNMKKHIKKHWFIIAIIILAIVKQLLVTNVPITPYPNQAYDDGMMVEMAKSIREGNWLGNYSSNILVKGPMMPLLIAIINYTGLSYINTMNIIYTISCMYFIYTLKDTFKSKKSLLAIYTVLLFNPVSYAWWTLQRVYRNGITLAQVLLIIGSMFAIYQKRNEKTYKILPFSIISGLSLASLWLTREDGIWILPFILVVTLITIILLAVECFKKKNLKTKSLLYKTLAVATPIIILIVSLNITRTINYLNYGVYGYNEINDGYFGKVIKTIYSVKTDEDIQYVTATRKKINLLYEHSETLNSIKPELEASMDAWDYNDRHPGDTQVEDGWFWWSLKEAAEKANIYENAKKADEFYEKVYTEIHTAIKEGKIETQMTMPSNLMSPWKTQYIIELPKTMARMTLYIVNFEDVQTVNVAGDIPSDELGIRKFESITNDLAANNIMNNEIDNTSKYTEKYVQRLNFIGEIYKKLGLIIAISSFMAYVLTTIKLIKAKDKKEIIDAWLLLTGIACSYIVLVGGVSYNHITSCFSRYYMYLSGAYPLITVFCIGNISYFLENYKFRKKEKTKNKNI